MIIDVSAQLVGIPAASLFPHVIPLSALISIVFAFLSLVLFAGHMRIISGAFLILSMIQILLFKQPDILISATGKLTGYKPDQTDLFYISTKQRQRFETRVWRDALGVKDKNIIKFNDSDDDILCDETGCRWSISKYNISFLKHENALRTECSWADIVIYEGYIDGLYKYKNADGHDCPIIITAADTYKKGAHSVYFDDDINIIRDKGIRGDRPWVITPSR